MVITNKLVVLGKVDNAERVFKHEDRSRTLACSMETARKKERKIKKTKTKKKSEVTIILKVAATVNKLNNTNK